MSQRGTIREALASHLDSNTSAHGHARAPRQVNSPALVIVEFDQQPSTFGFDLWDYSAVVRGLMSGDIEHALDKLDDIVEEIGPALEVDDTLGGACHHAVLRRIRGDSEAIVEIQGVHYYILEAEVEILGA